jgi:hypothetical protein
MTPDSFAERFGAIPARPRKGEAVAVPAWDLTRLDELTPHPVYAWMSWVQILSPTRASFDSLQPLLTEGLEAAKRKWEQRNASRR